MTTWELVKYELRKCVIFLITPFLPLHFHQFVLLQYEDFIVYTLY